MITIIPIACIAYPVQILRSNGINGPPAIVAQSMALFAVNVAPPVALRSLRLTKETVTAPGG
jgi:hypothetical protein